jgi:hypothetical protein
MKKLFVVLALFASSLALAQPYHYRHFPAHGHGGGNGWGWVAPILIGSAVGYAIARPVQVEQPSIIIQPSNQIVINGIIYQKQLVYFDDCKCYKEVLTQVTPR